MHIPTFRPDFASVGPNVPPVPAHTPTTEEYPELNLAFHFFNHELFEGKLPFPLLVLHRGERFLGHYAPDRYINRHSQTADELMLNASAFAFNGIEDIMSTVVHEQAHQYQRLYGTPGRRGYHNSEYRDLMMALGLCTSSTGYPGGAQVGERMSHYIIQGGPFQLSCHRLLSKHKGIVWFERALVRRNKKPVFIRDPSLDPLLSALAGSLDDAEDGPTASIPDPEIPPPPPMAVFEAPTIADSFAADEQPLEPVKPTRWKYTCPAQACKISVWAKPRIRVRCDEHNQLLVSADA